MRASNGESRPSTQPLVHLPPREVWLYNPFEKGKKKTPTDSRGFVDLQGLLDEINTSIDPKFRWMRRRNEHHLQWSKSRYPSVRGVGVNPRTFRELTSNKVMLPLDYHRWLHELTEPPEVPKAANMALAVQAETAVFALKNVVRFARETVNDYAQTPEHAERVFEQMLESSMDYFGRALEWAGSMPEAYQLADFGSFRFETPQDILAIVHSLGFTGVTSTPDIAPRIAYQEAA